MTGTKTNINQKSYRKPKRTFEKSGSVDPKFSYYVPLENVVNSDNQDIKTMVDRGRYFSIFAPWQSGKTTFLEELRSQLHLDPTYVVVILGFQDFKNLVGGVSPFNIADQVDFPSFSLKNVRDLYAQYTEETNQPFKEEAVKRVYEETAGQPWLVNRLGTILTVEVKPGTTEPINENDVDKAIKILLLEKNDHFDNLYEKAILYKETFVRIVFDNVKYKPDDKDQSWLEQYGLIKKKEEKAVVANNIYKERFVETFFSETNVPEEISTTRYVLPGNRLDMENILLDFDQYIAQIGVRAFYEKDKPEEKTGQFLLTAWLYQFVKGGAGELRCEVTSGLGRMDILLTYKGEKYIIETKMNHGNFTRTLNDGLTQVSGKYLAPEAAHEGYLVIFDPRTPAGGECEPRDHEIEGKKVTAFIISIGKIDD